MIGKHEPGNPAWWRRLRELHFSNPAKPGPPPERQPATPQPPSRRRGLLLIVGIVATFTLLGPAFATSHQTAATPLTFSSFIHNVQHDRIVSATIGTDGTVTGTLKGGRTYESQIPLALQDNQLTGLLEQHRVTITGVGPQGSLVGTLLSFLPFLLIVGAFLYIGRASRR